VQNDHLKHHDSPRDRTKDNAERASSSKPAKAGAVNKIERRTDGKSGPVKIDHPNGSIEEERIYPRSGDPRVSWG
jgi:hypothetical protein